jgi:putative ABC transport system substrate-binding protein
MTRPASCIPCVRSQSIGSLYSKQTPCFALSDNPESKSGPADENLRWLVLLALLLVITPCLASAQAQQQTRIPVVGWLGQRPITDPGGAYEILRQELRSLGYVEGKNIAFEYRSSDNKLDRLPALAEELVRLKVDVIIAPAPNEAEAAKKATKTIPIVFASGNDPVAAKLVKSIARPGGNLTGYTGISSILAGKRLELLKETIPKLSRVAVLWHPKFANSEQAWRESELSAKQLGLQLHSLQVDSANKLEGAFKEAINARSAALVILAGPLFISNQKQIANLALKHRMPSIGSREDFVDSGGLMSYGPDRADPYRHAARYVDKILKGTKPADLPVQQPTTFELVINLQTAKTLGLTIPPIVLMRAQRVIK